MTDTTSEGLKPCPTCGQTNAAFVCSDGYHAPFDTSLDALEQALFSELLKRGIDQDTADQTAQAVVAATLAAGRVEELERLREQSEKASPGPWLYEEDYEGSSMGWIGNEVPAGRGKVFVSFFEVEGDSAQQAVNAKFAVAAVNYLRTALGSTSATGKTDELDDMRKARR